MDHGQLACLCLLARLLQGELEKCLRLVISRPMADMDKYFGKYQDNLASGCEIFRLSVVKLYLSCCVLSYLFYTSFLLVVK